MGGVAQLLQVGLAGELDHRRRTAHKDLHQFQGEGGGGIGRKMMVVVVLVCMGGGGAMEVVRGWWWRGGWLWVRRAGTGGSWSGLGWDGGGNGVGNGVGVFLADDSCIFLF